MRNAKAAKASCRLVALACAPATATTTTSEPNPDTTNPDADTETTTVATQAGSSAPFPQQAGAASGLFGFLTQVAALLAGTAVGLSHDGTLLPLATISATTGLLLFAGAGILHSHRNISV